MEFFKPPFHTGTYERKEDEKEERIKNLEEKIKQLEKREKKEEILSFVVSQAMTTIKSQIRPLFLGILEEKLNRTSQETKEFKQEVKKFIVNFFWNNILDVEEQINEGFEERRKNPKKEVIIRFKKPVLRGK